jgi:hypothetical protein
MRWCDRDDVSFSELEGGVALINHAPSNAQQRYQSYVSALSLLQRAIAGPSAQESAGKARGFANTSRTAQVGNWTTASLRLRHFEHS